MAKNSTSEPTRSMPTTVINQRKMYSASAQGAIVEAWSGQSAELVSHLVRNCQSTGLICIVGLYLFLSVLSFGSCGLLSAKVQYAGAPVVRSGRPCGSKRS